MKRAFRVRDFMQPEVLVVRADWDIMRAVLAFLEHEVSGAPVIGPDNALVGMLTERDCLRIALDASYFDEPGGTVADFMSQPVQTVGPDDSLIEIAERFRDGPFRKFPVVHDGRLVGIIGRRDVMRALPEGTWFSRHD